MEAQGGKEVRLVLTEPKYVLPAAAVHPRYDKGGNTRFPAVYQYFVAVSVKGIQVEMTMGVDKLHGDGLPGVELVIIYYSIFSWEENDYSV